MNLPSQGEHINTSVIFYTGFAKTRMGLTGFEPVAARL
jgi:hypothetical protein